MVNIVLLIPVLMALTVLKVTSVWTFKWCLKVFLKTLFDRESERERESEDKLQAGVGGGGRSRLPKLSRKPNEEIMTWAYTKSLTLDGLSHPEAPWCLKIFKLESLGGSVC